jgi:hypothetical protein
MRMVASGVDRIEDRGALVVSSYGEWCRYVFLYLRAEGISELSYSVVFYTSFYPLRG